MAIAIYLILNAMLCPHSLSCLHHSFNFFPIILLTITEDIDNILQTSLQTLFRPQLKQI